MSALTNLIITFIVIAIVFFVCREIFCWYWKFNRMVELAEMNNNELVAIRKLLAQSMSQGNSSPASGE